ncbi:MAG: hypothetical protein U0531_19755 [Dehalococcoidia bacterium]
MEPIRPPRVEGLLHRRRGGAWLAIRYGAAALGLVINYAQRPRCDRRGAGPPISPARRLPGVRDVSARQCVDPDTIIAQQRRQPSTHQLVDRYGLEALHAALRDGAAGHPVMQVMHVTDEPRSMKRCGVAPAVDALLLDLLGNWRWR